MSPHDIAWLTPGLDHHEGVNQAINEDQRGNILKPDCIPDVIKGLSDFSAQPGECSSCRESVKRVLRLYDHLSITVF